MVSAAAAEVTATGVCSSAEVVGLVVVAVARQTVSVTVTVFAAFFFVHLDVEMAVEVASVTVSVIVTSSQVVEGPLEDDAVDVDAEEVIVWSRTVLETAEEVAVWSRTVLVEAVAVPVVTGVELFVSVEQSEVVLGPLELLM